MPPARAPPCRAPDWWSSLTPFKDADADVRRRAAADRAVHRDRRHLRQRRRPACRASTASSRRWAKRARPGRCCACSATCSAWPASSTSLGRRGARRSAGRPGRDRGAAGQSRTSHRDRDDDGAGGRCTGAHCRRADLRYRCAGAPCAVAAAHCRCAAAGGRRAERAVARTRPEGRRPGARQSGRSERDAAGARAMRRWPPTPCASRPGIPSTAALGAMFGAIQRREGLAHDRLASPSLRQVVLGAAWPVVWSLIKIVALVLPLMGCVAYLTLWERKAHRLDADPPRPEPRRPLWPADADRRCGQADLQGDHPPDGRQQGPVLPRPGDDHHAGAGGLGGDAVRPRGRAGQRQRRPAVPDGHHLDGGLRRDHRRLGLELEVRLPRRAARVGADGELRDRDGLRAGGRADGLGQPEHDRHRDGPGHGPRRRRWA